MNKSTKKLTTEEFIKRSQLKHGNKYIYSKVNYINSNTKVIIICPIHGEFDQLPTVHYNGGGCSKCGHEKISNFNRLNNKKFILKAIKKYGDEYDYSEINYISSNIKIKILHKKCQTYSMQTPNNHLGYGCWKCGVEKRSKSIKIDWDETLKRFKNIHGNKYSYSKVKYEKYNKKIEIECIKHGSFWQTPESHASGNGCPKCKESHGERIIRNFLEKNNIEYNFQKYFDDCRNPKTNRKLPFDFYLPKQNILIEYNGPQHYYVNQVDFKGNMNEEEKIKLFQHQKYLDELKVNYSKNNGMKLISIPFWKQLEISHILEKQLEKN